MRIGRSVSEFWILLLNIDRVTPSKWFSGIFKCIYKSDWKNMKHYAKVLNYCHGSCISQKQPYSKILTCSYNCLPSCSFCLFVFVFYQNCKISCQSHFYFCVNVVFSLRLPTTDQWLVEHTEIFYLTWQCFVGFCLLKCFVS